MVILGRLIATTFWGKAWCDNLEKYHDFANRLSRGRTYVRNGSVVDLQIAPLQVDARVSRSSMNQVSDSIAAVSNDHCQSLCKDCVGGTYRFPGRAFAGPASVETCWSGFAASGRVSSPRHPKSVLLAVAP